GRARVEIALGRGKKLYDKREAIGQREAQRQAQRALKQPGE
ncbi:MAG: SsrA-binding protein, partial [bacterium]|nr:SsrA-binding protein [bacterium]